MLSRRSFFATIAAPFLAKLSNVGLIAKPKPGLSMAALNAYCQDYMLPAMADNIFQTSPIFTRLQSTYDQAMFGGDRPSAVFFCDGEDVEDEYDPRA